jgi:PKD repeat protein
VTYATPGTYTATLTATNAAGSTTHNSTVQVNDCSSGINEIQNLGVSLHPNPFSDVCTLTVPESMLGQSFTVVDENGKSMLSGSFSTVSHDIDMTGHSSGVYYLKIEGAKGVLKLVKR